MRVAVNLLPIILASGALGGMASAHAQGLTAAMASQKLAGSTAREWILGDVRSWMGTSQACTPGEVDRFSADHTLSVQQCVDGKPVTSSHRWDIAQDGPIDILLNIDGKPQELLFRDDGTKHFMRLRVRSESKTTPTVDRDFRLSDD